jgi:hypothetical protein
MNARTARDSLRGALLAAVIGSTACAIGCTINPPTGDVDADCILDGAGDESERSPGYPYDFEVFKDDIAPLLVADCVTGACHADVDPPAGQNGGFTVFDGAADQSCDRVKTFKQLRAKVDLTVPDASRVIHALQGGELTGSVPHPLDYEAVEGGQAKLDLIVDFIRAASATCIANGGCGEDVRDYFDRAVFESVIQPGLDGAGDGAGCSSGSACHRPPAGQQGLVLHPAPADGSAEMEANYEAVKSRVSLDTDPRSTLLYAKATVAHGGGASSVVDQETADAMVAWIQAAIRARGDGDGLGCADAAQLDVGVFRDDILPILTGERDLNDPDGGGGTATGCTRSPCHGRPRPGSLTLIPDDPPEEQLANLACFVSLTSPSSSQVLLCPRKDPRCGKNPHPGERIFGDATDDRNYQRVLSFLFSAVTDSTPIDLAFFARRVNPMFDNRNAVEGGSQNRTCADRGLCHGIEVAGDPPPNRSNFGILPDAGDDLDRLRSNYTEAAAFLNFIAPEESSLFVYPTDEIANPDNPVSTGVHHPGGADFAVDSQFAEDILTFAHGLRPDRNGFQRHWLVAGDFRGVGEVGDDTPIDELEVRPQIFDDSDGGELAGRWDGLFEDDETVDVGAFLTGEVGTGRIAFAAAYLVNTTTVVREVDVELTSINDARIHVGTAVAEIAAGGSIRVPVAVPPSRASDTPTGSRILVKLFEAPENGGMSFTVRLLRAGTGDVFDDRGGELIIKLGPRGGI